MADKAKHITVATAPYRYGDRTRQARLCRFTAGPKAGRYFADYFVPPRDGHGGRVRPEIRATDEASAAAMFSGGISGIEAQIDAMLATADSLESGDPAIADLCRWYVRVIMPSRGNCDATRDENTRVLKAFTDWLAARGVVTSGDLAARAHLMDEYAAELCKAKKPGTVKKEIVKIKAVMLAALSRGRIASLPVTQWPIPKQTRPMYDNLMSPADFQKLIERLRSGTRNVNGVGEKGRSQIYGVVKFMSLQACRPIDACNLTWAAVHIEDAQGPVAIVRQQKTGNPVAMALSGEAVALIEAERARGVRGPCVFTGRHGKRITTGVVYGALKWHCEKLGIRMISAKRFRQYGVSTLIAAGADEMYVRSVTGHESGAIRDYKRKVDGRAHGLAEILSASLRPATDAADVPAENEAGAKSES